MAFGVNPYGAYPGYYPQPGLDYAQLRQNQLAAQMQQAAQSMPSAQMVSAQPATSGGIIWVQGEEGAKAYTPPPGASVLLMDSENQTFYIKSSDPSGMPLPLRVFDYTERQAGQKPAVQGADYVTREEFEALRQRIDSLTPARQSRAEQPKEETEHE